MDSWRVTSNVWKIEFKCLESEFSTIEYRECKKELVELGSMTDAWMYHNIAPGYIISICRPSDISLVYKMWYLLCIF